MSLAVAVIWINQQEARVFHLSEERMQRENVRTQPLENLMNQVRERVTEADRILVLGPGEGSPGEAKAELVRHLKGHENAKSRRVVGCETVEFPTDSEIALKALKLFSGAGHE